jgi:hypothetical protein
MRQAIVCNTAETADSKRLARASFPLSHCIPHGQKGVNDDQMTGGVPNAKPRSERRQKGRVVPFRVSPDEYATLTHLADRAGLTLGSYIRCRSLEKPTTRARRRPPAEVQVLTGYLGQLGKLASNANQLARRVNMGETPLAEEIISTLSACRALAVRVKDLLDGNT